MTSQKLKLGFLSAMLMIVLSDNSSVLAQETREQGSSRSQFARSIWQRVSTPNPNVNSILFSLSADSESDIWAVGNFVSMRFDGESWNAFPLVLFQAREPFEATMNAIAAVSPTDAGAVGDTLENIIPPGNGHFVSVIEHFDGTQWSIVPSPQFDSAGEQHAIQALAANNIFAVGNFNADSQQPSPLLEYYDGTTWSVIALPPLPAGQTGEFRGLTVLSDSDIWLTGDSGGIVPTRTLAMHFDGGRWSIVPVPAPLKGTVHDLRFGQGVTAIATNDIWAVGAFRSLPFGDEKTLTEHWDGKVWQIVHSPNGGPLHSENELRGVAAVSSTDVWACGTIQDNVDDTIINLIEHWDGTRWRISPVAPGNRFAQLSSMLAFPPGSVYAAGSDLDTAVPGQLDSVIFHTIEAK